MSIFSNIQRANKVPASGAPFTSGSADNGLSVDAVTGRIVIGQDVGAVGNPGQLTANREIPLQGFDFALGLVGSRRLLIDQNGAFGQDWLGDIDGAGAFGFSVHVDNNNGIINLGDYNGTFTGTSFFIDDSGRTFQMFDNRGSYFLIANSALGVFPADYQFGDIDDVNNGYALKIDERTASLKWGIGQNTTNTNLLLNFPSVGIGLSFFDSAGTNPFLLPDPAFGGIAFISAPDFTSQLALSDGGNGSLAQLGDVGAIGNGTIITVDENNQRVYTSGTTQLIGTNGVAYANNAAAAVGTLNNAPAAGNPTKWIPINDNGTVRNIPAW
jgi:hypothetical protein